MTGRQDRTAAIDASVPHSARVWNYWLGGKDHYDVDREAGEEYRKAYPGVVTLARTSRHFLTRTLHFLAGEAGLRQFLDVGTGLPTVDNTHEVAQRVAPASRIVYVDHDPLVRAHAEALLTSTSQGVTDFVHADLRDPDTVLARAAHTLDFGRPVGLILSGIMGHIPDHDEARTLVRQLLNALPSGSYLSLNDGAAIVSGDAYEKVQQDYNDSGAVPYVLRTREQIAAFFDGLELVEPGLVSCPRWRPEVPGGEPEAVDALGGVGRKP